MNVCVYASSSDAVAPVYREAARRLGKLLAEAGHMLIYGAGNLGLMGAMAEAVHAGGGQVTGVIPEKLKDLDLAYTGSDELVVTDGMRARKSVMEGRADAFIALPGGYGTLEEILEVLVLKQLWYHEKPIVFLNVNGFYDGLLDFFQHLVAERFAKAEHDGLYNVSRTPEEALAYIGGYEPTKPHGKWF